MSSPLLYPASVLYRLVRRCELIDVTRLWYLDDDQCPRHACPDEFQIRLMERGELAGLLERGEVDPRVGSPQSLEGGDRALVVAMRGDRVASFLWLASDSIGPSDNYSRASHLGTSVGLPRATAFIYNAWTDPRDRGRRLIASLVSHVVEHRVLGARTLVTSIDWTNRSSIAAFERIGMASIGTVIRFGTRRWQLSLLPKGTPPGVRVAQDAPGWKLALG